MRTVQFTQSTMQLIQIKTAYFGTFHTHIYYKKLTEKSIQIYFPSFDSMLLTKIWGNICLTCTKIVVIFSECDIFRVEFWTFVKMPY